MQNTPDISLIIPLLNEEESLLLLHKWILDVFNKDSRTYEVIFIDDGSTDNSWNVISKLTQKHLNVFGIKFVKNYGKSQALHAGFAIAKGNYIVTLDADLQDSPEEIPRLVDALSNQNLDLISGWKKNDMIPYCLKTYHQNYLIGQLEKCQVLIFMILIVD